MQLGKHIQASHSLDAHRFANLVHWAKTGSGTEPDAVTRQRIGLESWFLGHSMQLGEHIQAVTFT